MPRHVPIIFLCWGWLFFHHSYGQQQWGVEYLSQSRNALAAAAAGNKVLFAGGINSAGLNVATVDIFDVLTDTWSTASLSQVRSSLAATAAGNTVVFGGGSIASGAVASVDLYDTVSGAWTTWNLTVPRSSLAAAAFGSMVFFGGGTSAGVPLKTVDIYNVATNTWSSSATGLSVPRSQLAAASCSAGSAGKIVFAGGILASGFASSVVDIYDIATDSWTNTSLSQARYSLAGVGLGTTVYFGGGRTDSGRSVALDIFDLSLGSHNLSSLSGSPRNGLAGGVSGSKIIFAGGATATTSGSTIDIYDSLTQTLTNLTLSVARSSLAGAFLQNRTFFGGGIDSTTAKWSNVDIFDPITLVSTTMSTFTTTSSSSSSTSATSVSLVTSSSASTFRPISTTLTTSASSTLTSLSQSSSSAHLASSTSTTFTSAVLAFAAVGGSTAATTGAGAGSSPSDGPSTGSSSSPGGGHSSTAVIGAAIGGAVGGVVLIGGLIFLGIFCYRRRQRKQAASTSRTDLELAPPPTKQPPGHRMTAAIDVVSGQVDLGRLLGEGVAGKVYEGFWNGTRVALKQLSGGVDLDTEARTMKEVRHPNCVQFFGVYFSHGDMYLVMEFCSKGSLLSFLRTEHPHPITLVGFGRQIASGMQYLHSLRIIHRDLAARNVLVDDRGSGGYVLKVADFGLSKRRLQAARQTLVLPSSPGPAGPEVYYASNTGESLPIRWTAPEALHEGRHSTASDVWSFGVLLWEEFSFGSLPYPSLRTNPEVVDFIAAGRRMEPPQGCPPDVASTMSLCWQADPRQRPTFAQLSQSLERISTA